jgi:hypothetical protein
VNSRPQRSLSPDLANRQAAALLQPHAHRAGSVHPHLGAVSHQKEEELITDLKIVKKPTGGNRSENRKQSKINCCVRFFVCCRSLPARKGRREEAVSDLHVFPAFLAAASEWQWCMEKTRRHCSCAQKSSSTLFLQIPEGFGFFGVYFVILYNL